ncbi:alcohol dehydrogenase catalytic domain-containing protein [Actinoplanes sp. NPDC051633]|uniref:alcohol dehydrogenase catalytic domain-containing protein n=1 Tax=Actinoplanes sp. NPDC051633 TaxID=3155670 RepID=UPI00343204A1
MRAVVYTAPGASPELRDVPPPSCPPGGAIVDVRATGVCRSDWHAWRGHDPVPLPHIPGHEFAGVVSAVGPSVRGFAVGDRVTSPFVNGCGRCPWCLSGDAQVCPSQTQPGFTHAGSFAEQVVVHAADTNLVRLPSTLDFVPAAALGCRFATAFRALTAHARLSAGERVAIFGCGGVGLSAVMIAAERGAEVIAVDPSRAARTLALAVGATVAVESGASAASDVHVAVDAVGSAASADASVRSLRRRGRHVQIGLMLGANARAPLPWDLVVAHELRIFGSHGMPARDYPPMLEMVADGRLDPAALVGAVIGLPGAGRALMAMDDPAPSTGIVVIKP